MCLIKDAIYLTNYSFNIFFKEMRLLTGILRGISFLEQIQTREYEQLQRNGSTYNSIHVTKRH
jgi:hypothetical protein